MRGRVLVRGGAVVAAMATVGLGGYFAAVGLDEADKLASVIGVFVALAGLAVAVYGLVAERHGGEGEPSPRSSTPGDRSIAIAGDHTGIASTGDRTTNRQSR
ncbi:hypothetical protein [Actinomadura rubrisoli]|uniref:Uncharacterized protein n=1 Tax=Actinomadura rubrisoli TaxID=2530368 RepID=A0A4R4ZI94_9ACTN|nr:hypothetical protein [Actinomadura rubrisoli]TDD58313.1 hypothetical protein E1298_47180 [Actinomadura rubrisoli]